jgi:hypothetical protein
VMHPHKHMLQGMGPAGQLVTAVPQLFYRVFYPDTQTSVNTIKELQGSLTSW